MILKIYQNHHKPSIYLVRIFLNYIDIGKIDAHFIGYGTRFFLKLMVLFNSKIRKYEDKFSQIYII